MELAYYIHQMQESAQAIQALCEGVSKEQARWKPDPESWSILEVVNHLLDEEREDFRVRLDILLHRPDAPWPPIDPQGWVTERVYNTRDLADSLAQFQAERVRSIAWLQGLGQPDLAAFVETRFGRMAAGDMLAAWIAHDLLHLRQLTELRYAFLVSAWAPYSPAYAGDF